MNPDRYLPLVNSIASQIKASWNIRTPVEELIQVGTKALKEAAAEFQTRHGTTFRTFVQYRIRAAMYYALLENGEGEAADELILHSTINDLLQFYSTSAESTLKRSVHAEVEELKNLIQCLVPIWLLWKEAKGELQGNARDALNSALAELEEQEKRFVESQYMIKSRREKSSFPKPSVLRMHWKVLQKIRSALRRKLRETM